MKLRDYQQKAVNQITEHFKSNQKLCYQLATGGGKTFIFSYLANQWQGNVLILVNRQELKKQTENSIIELGGSLEKITVGMVETVNNRIKKNKFDLDKFDLLIVDECHRLEFIKITEQFKNKVLGFTATPVTDKVEYFFKQGKTKEVKWRRKVSLSRYYNTLICGVGINDLINKNMLVPDENYIIKSLDLQNLKEDSSGQFSKSTEKKVFNNKASYKSVLDNYLKHCKGLKTMIFNSNTIANKEIYQIFKNEGLNVRMYDSRSGGDREDLVNWFKSEKDAILLNVGVFTTGFDCKEVEAIVLNRATKSLALYLQMVGRGGRITEKIYKPKFKVIDLGGNVQRFGSWSNDKDWQKLFKDETEKKVKEDDTLPYWECSCCGLFNPKSVDICEECETERYKYKPRGFVEIAEVIEYKLPDVKKLIDYAKRQDKDLAFIRREYYNAIAEMFIVKGTSKEKYLQAKESGELKRRLSIFVVDDYFLIQKSGVKGNIKKTMIDFFNQIEKKIDKVYC